MGIHYDYFANFKNRHQPDLYKTKTVFQNEIFASSLLTYSLDKTAIPTCKAQHS